MTNPGSTSPASPPPEHRDITDLANAILEGDRRQLAERPPPPPRRIRPEALASLRVPAVVVQFLLAGWLVFGVVAIVFGTMQRSLLHRVASNPARVTLAELVADQHRVNAINGVFLGLLAATGIAFLVWFRLAYRNLDALDLTRRYGAGWAIGGWFVPFLNFVRPKQVADDIWASVNVSKSGEIGERGGSLLLGLWWAAWIGASLLGLFARGDSKNRTLDQALTSNGMYLARDALFIVAAVLAVFVVRCITRAQTRRDEWWG